MSELLDVIAGQTSLIFKLCMDGHKEYQARRVFEEKYVRRINALVGFANSE